MLNRRAKNARRRQRYRRYNRRNTYRWRKKKQQNRVSKKPHPSTPPIKQTAPEPVVERQQISKPIVQEVESEQKQPKKESVLEQKLNEEQPISETAVEVEKEAVHVVEEIEYEEKTKEVFVSKSKKKKEYYHKFADLSSLILDDDSKDMNDADESQPEIKFTKEILNTKPSGDPSKRDTLLHVLNGLAGQNGQKCVFFSSSQHNKKDNSYLNIAEANKAKPFVLTLAKTKSKNDMIKMNNDIKNGKENNELKELRRKLAMVHNVDESRIEIKSVFEGSFNAEYVISDLSQSEINKVKTGAQGMLNKMNKLFNDYVGFKIHPLLFRQTYDIDMFDAAGNKTFTSAGTFQVGPANNTHTYTQPNGWTRYGLKVLGKYGNDKWLDPFQDPGNWYRAYHGTKNAQNYGVNPIDAIKNIHTTGFNAANVAAYGPGVYCSPHPQFVEGSYAGSTTLHTVNGNKTFKFMIMVAVNPSAVKKATNDIWVAQTPADIRPYGILIKTV